MGLPPNRIDLLTDISGVSYDEAVEDTVEGNLGPESVRCIGFEALLRNERAAGRPRDLGDVAALEELRARRWPRRSGTIRACRSPSESGSRRS